MLLKYRGAIGCLSLLAAGMCAAAAASDADPLRKLHELRARMGKLGAQIAFDAKARDRETQRLRSADIAVGEKRQALESVRIQRAALQARRARLLSERTQAQQRLDAERAELAHELRAAYMIGGEDRLKMWLNQDDAPMLGRMSVYYGYFGRARARLISAVDTDVNRLTALEQEIEEQDRSLDAVETLAASQLQALMQARTERGSALAALREQVRGANEQMARLKHDEQSIQSVIEALRRSLPAYSLGGRKSFALMKGKLPWPVQGKIAVRFHQLRSSAQQDSVRWNGLVISANRSGKILAPYFGRVVFADWLQGLGLMLIIDHGGGYMTLFGRAEVLYKRAGDSVNPGDVIASLPEDGEPQLYFEIRQGRDPVDPQVWLKAGG